MGVSSVEWSMRILFPKHHRLDSLIDSEVAVPNRYVIQMNDERLPLTSSSLEALSPGSSSSPR